MLGRYHLWGRHNVACSHAGGWHSHGGCCQISHWTVGQPIRQPICQSVCQPARHVVMVWRRWRLVIQDSKFILLGLEIFVTIGADFAIWTGFMCATMSVEWVGYRSYMITKTVCTTRRLTEQDCQIAKRPSGSEGRHMVAPEYGSSHV